MKDKSSSRRRTIRLAPGRRLRKSAARSAHVLSSPNGPVQLNETAARILALCDSTRTREEIVARILALHSDSLASDVGEFLDAALRRGWILEA
ncbi:MAG TPA: pyrroloquinoline quinone biosynthesis peptide chaperone PqqD [Steroidobacteraceae bacterium]|nr:pyrroloquinoline quinone biosynthesis peptide chaperone PqqD [Steroidobacteraceae bacterium]